MKSKYIHINPDILKWARKTTHLELHEIPKTLISSDRLSRIESGLELPTFSELQKLAIKYDRSIGVLLSDLIPENDYFVLPFFRKANKTDYDSALTMYIRDIQDKQDWARNYLISEGGMPLDFIGSIQINENFSTAASKIKDVLGFPEYFHFSDKSKYLKAISQTVEEHNIFISITGSNQSNKSISIEQAQGFAISDPFAPFIFVNTKNTTNAKIFTLIHELVHLFLNESGISENPLKYRVPDCVEDTIENFCNDVAGEILMPADEFKSEFSKTSGHLPNRINSLSRTFLVSELAICVKLWRLRLISYSEYEETYLLIYNNIQVYLANKLKKQEKQKGGDYYNNIRLKNGSLLSSLVYSAYKHGDILARDLGNILNVKVSNIDHYFSSISYAS